MRKDEECCVDLDGKNIDILSQCRKNIDILSQCRKNIDISFR